MLLFFTKQGVFPAGRFMLKQFGVVNDVTLLIENKRLLEELRRYQIDHVKNTKALSY